MNRVRLTKLSDNLNNLRTSSVEGVLSWEPEIGRSIRIVAAALEDGDMRVVETSTITGVDGDVYTTRNSTYRLEHLEEQ